MTIRPSYLRAIGKTFIWVFVAVAVVTGVTPYSRGEDLDIGHILRMGALGGVVFGVFVAIAFTPREISWDEEAIRISSFFRESGEFGWGQLEAWSPYGNGVFMLKFENVRTFQISPSGFRRRDWKELRLLLERRFAEKKTHVWVGVIPVRFRK